MEHELTGSLYLAAQNVNPFRSPLALYLTAEDPADGVLVKLAGEVRIDEATGQITSTFRNTPQLPFTHLRLHFFSGQRASLTTPALLRRLRRGDIVHRLVGGGPARSPASTPPFTISSGPGGAARPPSPLALSPGVQAGSEKTSQAGAFTDFTLQIADPDGSQALTGVTVHLPPGIAALLSSVTPCPEPAAGQQWSCGPQSLIGHCLASAGLGEEPFDLPGQVFLTAGYDGAPFGLLVSNPGGGGSVRPWDGERPLAYQRRSEHGGGDDHDRPGPPRRRAADPAEGGGCPDQTDQRDRRPPSIRVQPDGLHPHVDHGRPVGR